jgi:hypothetical protein
VTTEAPFFTRADDLRSEFTNRVAPDRVALPERFIWDYWHIPQQYTYFRTIALNAISPALLGQFTEALRAWGRANLGTDRITLPWLSYYIEGCRQELHSDVVQGMWSYVYSLTPWEDRRFTGGETLLGSPQLLDYWPTFDPSRSTESRTLVERIPALFDQLTVFDSRLPHGVAVVEGTRDPLEARVALHGWFHDPVPSMQGGLDLEGSATVLDTLRAASRRQRERLGPHLGTSTWRVRIQPDGTVADVEAVVDNLVPISSGAGDPAEVLAAEKSLLGDAVFERRDQATELLLPLDG